MSQPTDRINCPTCGNSQTLQMLRRQITAVVDRFNAKQPRNDPGAGGTIIVAAGTGGLDPVPVDRVPGQAHLVSIDEFRPNGIPLSAIEICIACGTAYAPDAPSMRQDLENQLEAVREIYRKTFPLDALAEEAD